MFDAMSSFYVRKEKIEMRTKKVVVAGIFCVVFIVNVIYADVNWSGVSFIKHSSFQAVNSDGSSAYTGGFPIKLIGVVLNNSEDWLDPTAAYDSGVHLWNMGGQAEIYVQAVNLDGTAWDTEPSQEFSDFGGTACWMGQNYGNHIMHQDPIWNYTDEQWYAELDRLGLWHPGTSLQASQLVRAGDLVEIRARGGLNYKGKMNVNEQHDNDYDRYDNWDGQGSAGDGLSHDFEIVILQKDFGLPEPSVIHISDIKDSDDNFIFDSARQLGGEHYQGSLVELNDVRVTSEFDWTANSEITVTDGVRSFTLKLGRNDGFDGTSPVGVNQPFNVIGIFDQSDFSGKGGYQMLVMNPSDIIIAIPEPITLFTVLLGVGFVRLADRKKI